MAPSEVIALAAALYGVTPQQVLSSSRRQRLSDCRTVVCHALCRRLGLSLNEAARAIGRTRGDVVHHLGKADGWLSLPKANSIGADIIRLIETEINKDKK